MALGRRREAHRDESAPTLDPLAVVRRWTLEAMLDEVSPAK